MPKPFMCPYCKSNRTTRKGFRSVQKGKVQLGRCKACGKRFTTKRIIPITKQKKSASRSRR